MSKSGSLLAVFLSVLTRNKPENDVGFEPKRAVFYQEMSKFDCFLVVLLVSQWCLFVSGVISVK